MSLALCLRFAGAPIIIHLASFISYHSSDFIHLASFKLSTARTLSGAAFSAAKNQYAFWEKNPPARSFPAAVRQGAAFLWTLHQGAGLVWVPGNENMF